jgi:hypothetical protein
MEAWTLTSSRRRLLGGVAATAALVMAASRAAAQGAARHVAGYRPDLVPTAATLGVWLKQLHDFGPIRATGTPQCRAFEEHLATEFFKLGCTIQRDQFRLMSWEGDITKCSVSVTEDGGGKRELGVIAYYPFGGSTTGKPAATGRLLWGGTGDDCGPQVMAKYTPAQLAEAIVVIDMPLRGGGTRGAASYYPGTVPDPLPPASAAPQVKAQGGREIMQALETKCRGLILCYSDVSEEAARYNYQPFSDQHRKIPAVWVGKSSVDYLKAMSGKAKVAVRCDAKLTPDARADSLLATLKGQSDEVVLLSTHTDGPNEINDDGALGLLAIATYMAKIPEAQRKRTFVFSLPTGHYAAGAVRDDVTGSGRNAGTGGMLAKYPEVVKRAVAHIAMEQLGGMDWQDVDYRWAPNGLPAPEFWLATPPKDGPGGVRDRRITDASAKLFHAALAGQDPRYARSGLLKEQEPGDKALPAIGGGEGAAMRAKGIPGVDLMGAPQYFFRCDPKGVIDKMSPQVMRNAVQIATKMAVLMDRLSVDQLYGRAPIADADLFTA